MNVNKNLVSIIVIALLLVSSWVQAAAMTPPDQVVKQTISVALKELDARRAELIDDRAELYATVERVLEPAVNFERVSKLVLAKHWRKASAEQQQEFVAEFKKSLLKTYATAIFDYSGEKIVYLPFAGIGKDKKGRDNYKVKVETQFITQSGQRVPVIYSMTNRDDTQWRMYDIKIVTDGAATSLVQLYKSQYSSIIEAKGISGLLVDLKNKNAEVE